MKTKQFVTMQCRNQQPVVAFPNSNVFFVFKLIYCGVESTCVHSELRPPIGLLCHPRMIMMETLVEWWLAGKIKVFEKKTLP
jgi:hypothetical protein